MSPRDSGFLANVGKILLNLYTPYATYKSAEFLYEGWKAADKDQALAVAHGAPLALFGCDASHGGVEKENQCVDLDALPDPEVLQGESKYQSGDFTVIMPQTMDPGVAQYYFNQMQNCRSFVKDTFGLDTPTRKLNMILRSNTCPDTFGWCHNVNTIFEQLGPNGYVAGSLNYLSSVPPSETCDEPAVAGQVSHVVRAGVAAFGSASNTGNFVYTGETLEEGLAAYTIFKVDEARYERSTMFCTPIASSQGAVGEHVDDPDLPISVEAIFSDCVEIVFAGQTVNVSFSDGLSLDPWLLRAVKLDDQHVEITVYDRNGDNLHFYDAGPEGPSEVFKYKTKDGDVVVRKPDGGTYQDLALNCLDGQNGTGSRQLMGQLFWMAVREKYGESKINDVLNAVTAIHRDEGSSRFSFFEVFVKTLGIGADEARELFTKFAISTSASFDDIQLCWPQKEAPSA